VGEHPLEQGSAVWVGVMPGGELLVPDLAQTLAALSESSADLLHHLKVDGKRLVFKAKLLPLPCSSGCSPTSCPTTSTFPLLSRAR
jgi:hypothetical protein